MPQPNIKYIDVAKAANALETKGEAITIDTISVALGTDDAATVQTCLKAYYAAQGVEAPAAAAPEPAKKPAKPAAKAPAKKTMPKKSEAATEGAPVLKSTNTDANASIEADDAAPLFVVDKNQATAEPKTNKRERTDRTDRNDRNDRNGRGRRNQSQSPNQNQARNRGQNQNQNQNRNRDPNQSYNQELDQTQEMAPGQKYERTLPEEPARIDGPLYIPDTYQREDVDKVEVEALRLKFYRLESTVLKEQTRRESAEKQARDIQDYTDALKEQGMIRVNQIKAEMQEHITTKETENRKIEKAYEAELKGYRAKLDDAVKKLSA